MPIKFTTKKPSAVTEAPEETPEETPEDHEPDFKIKDFPQNNVSYLLHQNAPRNRPPRHHNLIHISDLDPARRWCPREPALLTKLNRSRPHTFLATAQRMTFGMGVKGADLFMELLPPERVWGHWKCRACGHEHYYTTTPAQCSKCAGKRGALRYKEVLVRDPETGIVGSVDCFVDILGNGVFTGVEIKTEGNESFKKRSKPTFDHEWRTCGYLWLMNKDQKLPKLIVNTEEMRIVYITKEGWDAAPHIKEWGLGDWAKSPVKEYKVARNDDMVAGQLEKAKTYRVWRNAFDYGKVLPLPERMACSSYSCARAKECPVRKECWK